MTRARSIGSLAGINALSSVLGVAVLVLTANLFGTTREVEIFFAAQSLNQIIFRFIQSSQISNAFLPVYHRIRAREGVAAARAAYAVVLNRVVLAGVAIIVVMWLGAAVFLRVIVPGFSEADQELGAQMFRVICLLIPLQLAGGMQVSLANAEKWFGRPELMGPVAQVVTVGLLLALASSWGAWALVAALVAAQLVQNLGYVWVVRRMGYRHEWRLRAEGFQPGEVFRNLWATSGQMVAAQVFGIALNAALSFLPQGTFAVFRYVRQMQNKMGSLFLRPVSVVFFTDFAEAMQKDPARVRALARRAFSMTFFLGGGAAALLVACAAPALQGLLGSERFPPDQIRMAGVLLVWIVGLLLTQGAGAILLRLVVAAGMMGRMFCGIGAILVLAALSVWFLTPLWGLVAIVAVLYGTQILQIAWSWWLLHRYRPELVFAPDWSHSLRTAVAALVAGCAGWGLARGLAAMPWAQERAGQLAVAMVAGGICAAVFVVVAMVLRLPEMIRVLEIARLRFSGMKKAPDG